MRIACLGEVMIELSPDGPGRARIGVAGDTFNTAVYLRRLLGETAEVAYVTALGDEAMSERIRDALMSERISTDLIEERPGMSPGLYMISLTDDGERSFSYWRSAAAARTLFSSPCEVTPDALDEFDIVYLSAISIAILPQAARSAIHGWADAFRARGGRVAFDSNHRPRLWEDAETARAQTMEMWRRTDIALPSLDDEMALFEEDEDQVVARLRGAGIAFGALKRGERGPLSLAPGGEGLAVQPVADVVDTTAAGDSFNAGFLAALARGADASACMRAGHDLSAEVIRHKGAILPHEAMPG